MNDVGSREGSPEEGEHEPPQDTISSRARFRFILANIQQKSEAFKKGPLGFIIFAAIAALVLINELLGEQPVLMLANQIKSLNYNYLAIISLIILGILVVLPIKRATTKLILVVSSVLFCIPLVMSKVGSAPDDLVIVYDYASRDMYPKDLSVSAVDLSQIDKLIQAGNVNPNSMFLSLVEQPVEAWQPIFGSSFRPRLKILSLREVLEVSHQSFVDISSSNFVLEITHALSSRPSRPRTYVVYFTGSYQKPAALLEDSLRPALPSSSIVSIPYRGRVTGLIHPSDAVLIYLGNSDQFPDFVRHISTRKYSQLVTPNWTVGEIDIRSNLAGSVRPNPVSSKGVLVISSPARRLAEADPQHWSRVIETVRTARLNRTDVGNFVGNHLSRGMTIETIGFENEDVLR